MSVHRQPTDTVVWTEPSKCPFCGDELPDPGAGFIDHLDDSSSCKSAFQTWRDNVAGDMSAEWSG